MERPEHNTYDFPDDIETIFDVDIEIAKRISDNNTKQEYLNDIREQHCGTDIIYLHLFVYFLNKDKEKSLYYENLISKDYQTEIA